MPKVPMSTRHFRYLALVGLLILSVLTLMAVTAPESRAEVQTASVEDPADAPLTVSGVPSQPDIKNVSIIYDTAGALSLTVTFYNSPSALDYSNRYAFWGNFGLGVIRRYGGSPSCEFTATGMVNGQHHIFSTTGLRFYDQASVTGYEGQLPFQRTMSPDGRSITITASSPVLANRHFDCFEYSSHSRFRSTPSNSHSDYDSSCDCWYVGGIDDVAGITSTDYWEALNYFDGYTPTITMPSTRFWLNPKAYCRSLDLSRWTLLPDRVNGVRRGFPSKLRFELRSGGRTLTLSRKPSSNLWWDRLAPGRYSLIAFYPGDSWRKPSNTVRVSVRIPRC